MDNQKLPTLQIPQDVIEPIIQAHVRDAVLRAFDGYQPVVNKLITSILNVKVNANGSPCTDSYSIDRAQTWLDWAIGETIRNAVRGVIEQHIASVRSSLEKHIATELQRKNSPMAKQVAKSMLEGLGSAKMLKWNLHITAEAHKQGD